MQSLCMSSISIFSNMVVILTNSQIALNDISPENKHEAMVDF